MEKAKLYVFTSPTCPHCPAAKEIARKVKSGRDDFDLLEMSTASHEGQKKAKKFGIQSVPTIIINGNGYKDKIGLVGVQSERTLNKYLDIATGKKTVEEAEEEYKKSKSSIEFKLFNLNIKLR